MMQSSKDYIRVLNVIHSSMLLVLVFLWAYIELEIDPRREKQDDIFYIITVAVFFVIGVYYSLSFSRKYIRKAKNRRGIREKLILYKRVQYTQWSIIFLATLLSIGAFIMTGEDSFSVVSGLFILILLICRPSINRTIKVLKLDDNEARIMRTPDAAL